MQKAPRTPLLVLLNHRSSKIHLAIFEAQGIAVALGVGGLGVATPFTEGGPEDDSGPRSGGQKGGIFRLSI